MLRKGLVDMTDFRVVDGSTFTIRGEDLRSVFDVLLDLDAPGALSAAALLNHESRQPRQFRPIDLSAAQGEAVRSAVVWLVDSRSRWLRGQTGASEPGTAADSPGD